VSAVIRRAEVVAPALWAAARAAAVLAAVVLPDGQCDYDNHDRYVVDAHRGGRIMLAAVVLGLLGAIALFVAAGRAETRRRRRVFAGLGLFSLLLVAVGAIIAVDGLIAFGCLE
jgi:membrane-associated PAP2 superfamily phosphatase